MAVLQANERQHPDCGRYYVVKFSGISIWGTNVVCAVQRRNTKNFYFYAAETVWNLLYWSRSCDIDCGKY